MGFPHTRRPKPKKKRIGSRDEKQLRKVTRGNKDVLNVRDEDITRLVRSL